MDHTCVMLDLISDSKVGDVGDVGDQGKSDVCDSNNGQVLVPIGPITRACAKKLKDQLSALVHVVHASIEGSKMVEELNPEDCSIVNLIQVIQQASH